jgi:hypothetical protein
MILKHYALVKMLIYYNIMCMLPFYPHLMMLFMFVTSCIIVDIFISLSNLLNVVPPVALHHLLFCSSYPCRIVFNVPLVSCINWILYCIQFIEVRCCVYIAYYFVMYRLLG